MAEVPVSEREFRQAFRQHKRAYEHLKQLYRNRQPGSSMSHSRNLLLFYAVECALKARLMREFGATWYHQLPDEKRIGHRLNAGFDQLKMPLPRIPGASPRIRNGVRVRIRYSELHQAWRYGISLHPQDEKAAVDALEQALKWLESD